MWNLYQCSMLCIALYYKFDTLFLSWLVSIHCWRTSICHLVSQWREVASAFPTALHCRKWLLSIVEFYSYTIKQSKYIIIKWNLSMNIISKWQTTCPHYDSQAHVYYKCNIHPLVMLYGVCVLYLILHSCTQYHTIPIKTTLQHILLLNMTNYQTLLHNTTFYNTLLHILQSST